MSASSPGILVRGLYNMNLQVISIALFPAYLYIQKDSICAFQSYKIQGWQGNMLRLYMFLGKVLLFIGTLLSSNKQVFHVYHYINATFWPTEHWLVNLGQIYVAGIIGPFFSLMFKAFVDSDIFLVLCILNVLWNKVSVSFYKKK